MKTICQECGKELSSWGELHTYQMCGNYHLQRAEEILGFSLRNQEIYKQELEKMRKAYSDVSSKIDILFNETENKTLKRKMAELFKFAYMEAEFEDMRDKWPNQEAAKMAAASHNSISTKKENKP